MYGLQSSHKFNLIRLSLHCMNSYTHTSPQPYRQIRAEYGDDWVVVYQAYNEEIASTAVAAGTFVCPPFKMSRMTWIKPSFLWMMYRSGWGRKDAGQACVLAIRMRRSGFEQALRMAQLSHYDPAVHTGQSKEEWLRESSSNNSSVVIQWDPERDCHGRALDWRSIQIGLRGEAVELFVREWIIRIDNITPFCSDLKALVDHGCEEEAYSKMPKERSMILSNNVAKHIGATQPLD